MNETSAPAGLAVRRDGPWLHLRLDRPARRNAMSLAMVEALLAQFAGLAGPAGDGVRAVVLRGTGGHFCSGGDVADMQAAAGAPATDGDPIARLNRRFGALLEAVDAAPVAVVAVCEGAVMGGGFGLACVADLTLAGTSARFRLPETGLGITPAQIAPFIVQRVGLSQARRLAVTGQTLGAAEAVRIGLAHEAHEDGLLDDVLAKTLAGIRRCEPGALAATKALVRRVGAQPLGPVLDAAAAEFAALARRPEAAAGMLAMLTRSAPPWAED